MIFTILNWFISFSFDFLVNFLCTFTVSFLHLLTYLNWNNGTTGRLEYIYLKVTSSKIFASKTFEELFIHVPSFSEFISKNFRAI